MKDNFDIFFRRKPALMLVSLKKNTRMRYGSVLAKEVDCTYSHAVKILQTLEDLKLVDFEKRGRIKVVFVPSLTCLPFVDPPDFRQKNLSILRFKGGTLSSAPAWYILSAP